MPPIGPGTLVLVVGPSGAGKDTLMAMAQDEIGPHAKVAFPRRIVTREASAAEDHVSIPPEAFDAAARDGAFAFWWQAHGLQYGLPAAIDADIRRGVTVVCNVSRAIVPRLRRTYTPCKVVLIEAPRDVRAQRLRMRGRAADGDESGRLDREAGDALAPNLVIDNVGDPAVGARLLANEILNRGVTTEGANANHSPPAGT